MAAFEAVSNVTLQTQRLSIIDVRFTKLPACPPPMDDFDPRDHREPRTPIKLWMAHFNILRASFGPGMLGMPLALSQAGIILGPILSLALGALVIHTHLTLLWCLNEISRQLQIPYISYRYGFRLALLHGPPCCHGIGHCGPAFITTFMILSQIGICTVLVIIVTDNLRDIMDWPNTKTACYVMLVPFLILELAMKDLKFISNVSMFGNFMNIIGLSLVYYHIFKHPHSEVFYASRSAISFLFAFGSMLFNMSAISVTLSMDKSLPKPRVMTERFGVITVDITVVCLVVTITGILGYWSFGTMEENILRSLPFSDDTTMACFGFYIIAIACAYPIQCYPVTQIILEVIKNYDVSYTPSSKTLKIIEWVSRPAFVLLTFHICYFVPFQAPFVAFVGNLCTTVLSIVCPALMDLCLRYPDRYGKYCWIFIKDMFLIVLGFVACFFGVFFCGYIIYVRFMSMQSANDKAAFETISSVAIQPYEQRSLIDVRFTRLPVERPPLDDFDPRNHREPRNPIQVWMAYFNLLRTGFGAGMLGMPLAVSQVGIVLGPILVLTLGALLIHTHIMLIWCLDEISRQLKIPDISYRYGFRLALLRGPPCCHCLGGCGPSVVAFFMILSQLGICTVFVIFTTDSLRDIMDWHNSKTAVYVLLLPYLIMELSMKNLTVISYVSLFGNMMNVLGLILVFYHIFKEPHGETVEVTFRSVNILFSIGNILFNMSAVGVVLSMEKSLVNPKVLTDKFGVITIGLSVTTVMSAILGTLGYWSFGSLEENILRSLPFDDNSAMAAIGLYMLAVAFAYPIQCYPAMHIIIDIIKNHDRNFVPADKTLRIMGYVARPIFVLLTFYICYYIPFQGPFVAFVGNLCTTLLALVFPAMMELCLKYPDQYGKYGWVFAKDLLLIVLGLISWLFGIVFSIYIIYIRILSMKSTNDID